MTDSIFHSTPRVIHSDRLSRRKVEARCSGEILILAIEYLQLLVIPTATQDGQTKSPDALTSIHHRPLAICRITSNHSDARSVRHIGFTVLQTTNHCFRIRLITNTEIGNHKSPQIRQKRKLRLIAANAVASYLCCPFGRLDLCQL